MSTVDVIISVQNMEVLSFVIILSEFGRLKVVIILLFSTASPLFFRISAIETTVEIAVLIRKQQKPSTLLLQEYQDPKQQCSHKYMIS